MLTKIVKLIDDLENYLGKDYDKYKEKKLKALKKELDCKYEERLASIQKDICNLIMTDCISMSRGAEILDIRLMEMREILKREFSPTKSEGRK